MTMDKIEVETISNGFLVSQWNSEARRFRSVYVQFGGLSEHLAQMADPLEKRARKWIEAEATEEGS
jgi:hypothetical protein